MRDLARALARAFAQLIPAGRHRWQALALVLIGTAIPVTELLVTRMFTQIISVTAGHPGLSMRDLAPQLMAFCVLFVTTRFAHYGQRIYRVHYFERVFRAGPRAASASAESWRWALGMELVGILTFLAQLAVMAAMFTVLDPVFGLLNLALLALLMEVVGRIFARQRVTQRSFVERKRAGDHVSPFVKLRSRVVSAEAGGFFSSAGIILLLIALIAMSLNGLVAAADTIVLFLGLRMQNSTFIGLSGAVMRMARAHANTY